MTRRLILATALWLTPALAWAQPGGPGRDCSGEARFDSRPLGDGRYLYQFSIANPDRTRGLRYQYSFALPGGAGQAEALNGYLPPGGSIEHSLGTGGRNLGADALRAATTLRCFPL
jgi:hypothetical protein